MMKKHAQIELLSNKLLSIAIYLLFPSLFLIAYIFTIPAEDAVILYEYAKNLATKGIITYGNSEIPIEGATDFLWMLVISFFKWFGINEFASALFLNLLALIYIFNLFENPKHKFALLILVMLTPFLYSSLNGFSTITFSAVYILCLKLLFEKSRYFFGSLLLLCLVRPDGVVWGSGLVVIRLLMSVDEKNFKNVFVNFLCWLVIPGLAYFIWRFWYFGELFPLPFIVKSSSTRDFFIFYRNSIDRVLIVLVPIIFTLIAFVKNRNEFFRFLLILSFPVFFYSLIQLEQNIGNRFMAPMFFGTAFLFSIMFGFRALLVFSVGSLYFQVQEARWTALDIANSLKQNVYYISNELSSMRGRMLITEAGRLTYYSNWFSEDSWGLNTPRYAHKLISKMDIKEGSYDLIVGHCQLSLLEPSTKKNEYNQSKDWSHMCETMVSYIRENSYTIFLVPTLNENEALSDLLKSLINKEGSGYTFSKCMRHDIYAVSNNFADAHKLTSILKKYGGVLYSPELKIDGWDRICKAE